MAFSNFAAGLGGFTQGMEAGEDLRSKWDARKIREADQKGKELWVQTETEDDPDGPAGPAGQVGQPQATPTPLAPVAAAAQAPPQAPGPPQGGPQPQGGPPGATPMPPGVSAPPPMAAGPPPQARMSGAQPMPAPGGPPPAMPPQAGPAPAPGPAGPQADGGQPQGGPQGLVAQFAAMKQQNKSWLKQRAQAIRQKFPNATPAEIAAALEYGVKQDNEMGGTEKMLLQSQVAELRAETMTHDTAVNAASREEVADVSAKAKTDVQAMRDQTLTEIAQANNLTKVKIADLNDDAKIRAASMSASARVQAAGITASSHVTSAQISAGARTMVAEMGGNEKEWEAQLKADVSNYRTQAGGMPTTAPAPGRAAPPRQAPGSVPVGQPSAAPVYPDPAKGKFKSPDDVKAAFHAGKLSKEQAADVLKRDFGFQ